MTDTTTISDSLLEELGRLLDDCDDPVRIIERVPQLIAAVRAAKQREQDAYIDGLFLARSQTPFMSDAWSAISELIDEANAQGAVGEVDIPALAARIRKTIADHDAQKEGK